MLKIVGIDPGQRGALASVCGDDVDILLMPYIGKELDCRTVYTWLKSHDPDMVILERQIGMAAQGRTSIFSIAKAYGELRSIVEIIGCRYYTPLPSQWTKTALAGVPGDKKQRNILACHRAFPNVSLIFPRKRKPHDGAADALLLAEYGRRMK